MRACWVVCAGLWLVGSLGGGCGDDGTPPTADLFEDVGSDEGEPDGEEPLDAALDGDGPLDATPDGEDPGPELPPVEGPFSLSVHGTGFEAFAGTAFHAELVHEASGSLLGGMSALPLGSGEFQFGLDSVLEAGEGYALAFYFDVDDSGTCDEPPADAVWWVPVEATGDVELEVDAEVPMNGAGCQAFGGAGPGGKVGLTVEGSGFGALVGQPLQLAVVEVGHATPVATGSMELSGDGFTYFWPGVLTEGKSYQVDYFFDVDGDDLCDWDVDPVWRHPLGEVTGPVSAQVAHSEAYEPLACAVFDPMTDWVDATLTGEALDAWEGQKIAFRLTLAATGEVLGTGAATVSGGEVALTWPALLKGGQKYFLDLLVDPDEDLVCQPGVDVAWRLETGKVMGDVAFVFSGQTPPSAAACATFAAPAPDDGPYDLTVEGAGFTNEEGKLMHVAVVAPDGDIAAQTAVTIEDGAWAAGWQDLLTKGEPYTLAWFVDMGGDGVCQWPAEPAWRWELPPASKDAKLLVFPPHEQAEAACEVFSTAP